MDTEKVEKLLQIKILDVETIKGKVFPLFDLVDAGGLKLALIENPTFIVIDNKDVFEKRVEGEYVVVQKDDETYLLMKYAGEPNIDMLRIGADNLDTKTEEAELREDEDAKQKTKEEVNDENVEEQGRDNAVEKILKQLPKWADGAVVVEKDGSVVVLPVKRSTKKEGYYASTTWRPLDVHGVEELLNYLITKDGKTTKASIYVSDKYINVYTNRKYSKQRRQ